MTNPTAGFGLRAVRRLDGAALSFQMVERRIAYNDATTIGTGDLVTPLATGYVTAYTAADAITGGVFAGCKYLDPSTGRVGWFPSWTNPSLPSTTVVTAFLIADPNIVFDIRSSGDSAAIGIEDVGANFEVTVGTPNAQTGQSTTTLLGTSAATTATLPLKMVSFPSQLVNSGYNDDTLVNNIVQVRLNTLQLFAAAGLHT